MSYRRVRSTKRQTSMFLYFGTFNMVEITRYKHRKKGVWQGRQCLLKAERMGWAQKRLFWFGSNINGMVGDEIELRYISISISISIY